jgi:hypothetical protein
MGYTAPVVGVKQNDQPTTQGVPTGPTVYFKKMGDHRYGFPGWEDVWDTVGLVEQHVERQMYETTFEVMALVISNPTVVNTYTASDLVNAVAQIMSSYLTLVTLNTAGVSILRISEVSNPYFIDDMDRYEASPTFEFTLTYEQVYVTTTNAITMTEIQVNAV